MHKEYNNFKKVGFMNLVIICIFLIVSCGNSDDGSSSIVFRNVNVIPMNTETILYDYNLVIKDGKIVKLGKSWKTKVPKNATIIDGKDKYLLPGLADMHVHLWLEDELILYLANGVTTIRDMFGNFSKLSLRDKVE